MTAGRCKPCGSDIILMPKNDAKKFDTARSRLSLSCGKMCLCEAGNIESCGRLHKPWLDMKSPMGAFSGVCPPLRNLTVAKPHQLLTVPRKAKRLSDHPPTLSAQRQAY